MTSMAKISDVKVYDYRTTKNVANFQILPVEITDYYQDNTRINPLGLTMESLVSIATWQDKQGDNYLVQFKRPKDYYEQNNYINEVVSHLYVADGNGVKRHWEVYDSQELCDLDVIADFADYSPILSDVDNNGVAEVAITYYLGCRGDVSYDEMKVIMYEGRHKFAARGNSAICDSQTNRPVDTSGHYGGDYTIDKALLNRSGLKTGDKILMRKQLESVWQQTQCSIHFNYSDI